MPHDLPLDNKEYLADRVFWLLKDAQMAPLLKEKTRLKT